MNCESIKSQIVTWLKDYAHNNHLNGFVVGVSGGVDSALVSTLCAETEMKTFCLNMPIRESYPFVPKEQERAERHVRWLEKTYPNTTIRYRITHLANTFKELTKMFGECFLCEPITELATANSHSRLRMLILYAVANSQNLLVAGTGNKCEDFGCGFFTKQGDGGIDISPIGDLMKSEVRELAKYLGVADEIVNAVPTDGLWDDGRSDEAQIGATYDELEWAMEICDNPGKLSVDAVEINGFKEREAEILKIYINRHEKNLHKMSMPPICKLNKEVL